MNLLIFSRVISKCKYFTLHTSSLVELYCGRSLFKGKVLLLGGICEIQDVLLNTSSVANLLSFVLKRNQIL